MPDTAAIGAPAAANDNIEISLPLKAEFASTLRLMVSSLGADTGFSIDEIDDLRLAVSEVFTAFVEAGADASERLTASFAQANSGLTVSMTTTAVAGPLQLDPLARTILASVVDSHHVDGDGVTLHKQGDESRRKST